MKGFCLLCGRETELASGVTIHDIDKKYDNRSIGICVKCAEIYLKGIRYERETPLS